MGYIAVAENEKYEMEAESNRVNLSLIPPRRGWNLDRNGSPLASNRADFRVDIIPERLVDAKATVATLSELLAFDPAAKQDLSDKLEKAAGFQPVQVSDGLDYDTFAAISVRLPELPGVVPTRGFSRFYPTGPSVGHLIGYVGAASREEYEAEPVPLLVTPGFKLGKDGLEKQFEQTLRGEPGARRVEVTASGRIVRDLDMREDVQGNAIQLTIDGPLQDYAARRIGLESGSVVVLDCLTGDLLCMASMPSFDQEFPLPVASQFFGTVPDPAWKLKKYGQPWASFVTVNATIGQGYMLFNPLQLAVYATRIATGNKIMPRLMLDKRKPSFESMNFHGDHVQVIQNAMSEVVNGRGTAGRARLPVDGVLMAGKTGTAQVVSLNVGGGKGGQWKYRDHGLFIFFAPFDKPRYAGAVVIEHGGGSGAAYPIARDVMTFLFDPVKGMEALTALEKQWGGTAQQRLDRRYAEYASAAGLEVPRAPIETAD